MLTLVFFFFFKHILKWPFEIWIDITPFDFFLTMLFSPYNDYQEMITCLVLNQLQIVSLFMFVSHDPLFKVCPTYNWLSWLCFQILTIIAMCYAGLLHTSLWLILTMICFAKHNCNYQSTWDFLIFSLQFPANITELFLEE